MRQATAALLLAAFIALPAAAQSPSQALAKLADDMVEREFDLEPVRETYTEGRGPRAGRATIPPTGYETDKARAVYRELRARLEKIPRAGLGESETNTYDLIAWRVGNELERLESPLRQMQLLTPTAGFFSGLIYLATSSQPLDTEADFETWLQRVEGTAAACDSVIAAAEEGRKAGWTAPRPLVEKALDQMATIVGKPADRGTLWAPMARYPKSASEEKRKDYERRYREALDKRLIPGLARIAAYTRETYLPAARTTSGIGGLPGGDAAYRKQIRINTTLELTADEVHGNGLREVERITPKMLEVARGLGYKGSIGGLTAWVESSPSTRPFNTPEDVIAYLRKIHAQVVPGLPKLFKRLPKARFDIRLTPPALAATASASYSGPPMDGSRPGYFNMPVVDAKRQSIVGLATVLLHEGMPGHHLDGGLRRELDLPRFRRNSWITAYGEGWGLYAESLGHELGVYEDPWALLGRYSYELRRAGRLVVDTGLHAKGWTREQGIRYLREEAGQFEREATVETERYMANPGQALAYKVGELEILALRAKAQKALGPKFDLREFHEAVLGEGPLPLPLLRRRVDGWIAKQAAA